MTRQEHLLTIAAEECAETAQRISKALRFGLDEVEAGQDLPNADRIVQEFNDLVAMMQMLERENIVPNINDYQARIDKQMRVERWLRHSKAQGTLTE